jgi:hypothetical protein
VVRRPRPRELFSRYENFIYLLTELELAMKRGGIEWSETMARAAKRRLEVLATRMERIIAQSDEE